MILAALLLAAAHPQPILTVDPKHRLIEGIATDGRTIWLTSLMDRQILACRTACKSLAAVPAGLHPFAIGWDSKRGRLWVAAGCPPGVWFIAKCEGGALLGFDRLGRIRSRLAPVGGAFQPGDVSAANGEVFVSDSQNGAVYRLTPDGTALLAVIASGTGKSGQGSALSPDGKTLIVADYSVGLAAVDLASGVRTLLPRDDGKPLRGIDGLVRCGSTYFGVYNGTAPGGLVSFTLGGKGLADVRPVAGADFPDPTQVAFDGRRLLVVADSGWASADKPPATPARGASIVAISLGRNCTPS